MMASWFGNICHKIDALEADDTIIKEHMNYLSEKLTIAGDNFFQFWSDVADVLPTSVFSSAEQTVSEEEETTPLSVHVHKTSDDIKIDHDDLLDDSSSDKFVAKETVHSSVAEVVEKPEQTAQSDSSVSEAEKDIDWDEFWDEFLSKYTSPPVDRTIYSSVVEEVVEELVSNDVHDEKLVNSSCVAQVVEILDDVNEDDMDDAQAKFPISNRSSERAEEVSDSITFEVSCSSDSNSINHELEPPKTFEPDQFLSDSDFDSMISELEPPKKIKSDKSMELLDMLDTYASSHVVSDCDVKEEDNEVTEQKSDESLNVVEVNESHFDSDKEEDMYQLISKRLLKKHWSKCIDAEQDEEDSETYDEDFSDSDCEWEFV